jgi:hypothetical protein
MIFRLRRADLEALIVTKSNRTNRIITTTCRTIRDTNLKKQGFRELQTRRSIRENRAIFGAMQTKKWPDRHKRLISREKSGLYLARRGSKMAHPILLSSNNYFFIEE